MEMEGINEANKLKRIQTLEEADLKSFPANSNISKAGRCYFLRLEGDLRFEDVVGPASLDNLTRREFVIHLKHVNCLLEGQGEKIKSIQETSGATIAIISYPEGRPHYQARLELWGTHEQVETAELLVVNSISEVSEIYDVAFDLCSSLQMYPKSWVESLGIPRCVLQCVPQYMQRLTIFGGCAQIYRVLKMVLKDALKPYIPVETEDQASAKLEDENQLHHEAYVPSGQVSDSLLGANFCKVKEMEAHSGAQIVVDLDPLEDPGEGHLRMIRLKISGSRAQIYEVLTMVHEAILEPYIPEDQDPAKLEDENKHTIDLYAAPPPQHKKPLQFTFSYSDWLKFVPEHKNGTTIEQQIIENM